MAKFKLPPVSPLIGSNLINYFKIIFNNRISVKYYLNIFITFLIILLLTPFQFIDYLIFTFKLRNYTIKKDPIFIIGHWRSGTTFLHNLLCKDTNFSFFNTYNSVLINNLYTSFLFKTLMHLVMPKERPSDGMKLDVDLPQEDEFAVSNFNDLAHYLFFYFPNDYKKYYLKSVRFENSESDRIKWIKTYDKLIKRILIYTKKDQILIKNPSNTARIKTILSKYPNAKFIHIHRNPYFVYLSTYKFFYELFPAVQLQKTSEETIHKLVLYNYKKIYEDYYNEYRMIPKNNLIDIKFEDFKDNPLHQIQSIYRTLGIESFNDSKSAFIDYINENKSHKMNTYKISKKRILEIENEFSSVIKKMNYSFPKNLKIIN